MNSPSKDNNPLIPLAELIINHETWLMDKILFYAKEQKYTQYTSTLKEAWRVSICGLSQPLIEAIFEYQQIPELEANQDYQEDAITQFGISQAKSHRSRGINLTLFLGLIKYYRQSYLDLLSLGNFENNQLQLFTLFINRFFDRIELAFCAEWISLSEDFKIKELQQNNIKIIKEKNKYLTVFESINEPIFLFNTNNKLINLNQEATKLFTSIKTSGAFYYGQGKETPSLDWLQKEVAKLNQEEKKETFFTLQVKSNLGLIWLSVRLKKMLDVSEKFSGTVAICSNITNLIETQEKLRAIVNFNINGLIVTDQEGKILFINPVTEKIFDNHADNILGTFFGIPLIKKEFTEIIIPHKNGKMLTVDMRVVPIQWQHKKAFLVSLVDITRRKEAEEKLKFLYQASEQSPASIVITNNEGNIEYVNSKFEQVTGYSREEVLGKNPRILKSGHFDLDTYKTLWTTISSGKEWHGEFHNRKKNGDLFWENASISPIKNEHDIITHYVAVKEDITAKKKQEELLSHQANYDYLTQLPNRLLGMERLKQEITQANRNDFCIGLIFLDLDHFKNINDTLGHQYGDELLVTVSQRLSDCLRESDTVARLGGDEFLIIISRLSSPSQGEIIASKLLYGMRKSFTLAGEERFISASIGITFYPQDGENIQTLIKNADMAMYEAKKNGRNNFQFFNTEMNDIVQKKVLQENHLRNALRKDELSLVYQPIINLKTKKIIGVETLMRWHNNDLGDVYALEFITIAEETGLIIELGKWLIESVCKQLSIWRKNGLNIYASINLSPRQFRDINLPQFIFNTIKKYQIEPKYLKLEITEQVFLEKIPTIKDLLFNLHKMNFDLYLDDFGTGYSSLSYLSKYPFKSIKIDRSFIKNITDSEKNQKVKALVKTIIAMASNLDLLVIAEGIETQTQLNFLEAQNCFAGQGYLFSRPLCADNLLNFIDNFCPNHANLESDQF